MLWETSHSRGSASLEKIQTKRSTFFDYYPDKDVGDFPDIPDFISSNVSRSSLSGGRQSIKVALACFLCRRQQRRSCCRRPENFPVQWLIMQRIEAFFQLREEISRLRVLTITRLNLTCVRSIDSLPISQSRSRGRRELVFHKQDVTACLKSN